MTQSWLKPFQLSLQISKIAQFNSVKFCGKLLIPWQAPNSAKSCRKPEALIITQDSTSVHITQWKIKFQLKNQHWMWVPCSLNQLFHKFHIASGFSFYVAANVRNFGSAIWNTCRFDISFNSYTQSPILVILNKSVPFKLQFSNTSRNTCWKCMGEKVPVESKVEMEHMLTQLGPDLELCTVIIIAIFWASRTQSRTHTSRCWKSMRF